MGSSLLPTSGSPASSIGLSSPNVITPTVIKSYTYTPFGSIYQLTLVHTGGDVIPLSHYEDAQKLDMDAYVDLFEIIMNDKVTRLRLKGNDNRTWQGNEYEGSFINIQGVGSYADDTTARPSLTVGNPAGIFSYPASKGLLENGVVVRYRILKQHLDADLPIFRRQQWRISRLGALKQGAVILELRDMLDGQVFQVPGRMFIPPDFPMVNLQ